MWLDYLCTLLLSSRNLPSVRSPVTPPCVKDQPHVVPTQGACGQCPRGSLVVQGGLWSGGLWHLCSAAL